MRTASMDSGRSDRFLPPLTPEAVASAMRSRRAERSLWHRLRDARQKAWIILHDREDADARAFVNAIGVGIGRTDSIERLRAARLAALRRALRAQHPATRAMELATYRALKRSTADFLGLP